MTRTAPPQPTCVTRWRRIAANVWAWPAKRIIVFQDKENNRNAIMFNPRIIAGSDPFDTAEGCLSLDGERPTTRYQSITVTYQARSGREYTTAFDGFTAQIIQHEIDHVNGIII